MSGEALQGLMGTLGVCIATGNPFCGHADRRVLPLQGLGGGEGGMG